MGTVNILNALFGIFRQRGLVTVLKEDRPLARFFFSGTLLSILGGVLYGFAMGIGLGIDTALKDAIKVGSMVVLGLLFSIPIFWVAYRLLGRDERLSHVAAVPLTFVATVSIVLSITVPIVFMLSTLAGFSPDVIYVHIVIVNLALLVGLYLAGALIYHSFSDQKRLIVPNVVAFLLMMVILVVLTTYLAPFLEPRASFSVGTDRLRDSLGIGVAGKVERALSAASSADRMSYRFQTTNDNGDLVRDYTVTRVGNDALLLVHMHAVPDEASIADRRIWILDGRVYTDFDEGTVTEVNRADLAGYLEPALPSAAFTLPLEFAAAQWRAYERGDQYTATGVGQAQAQATLVLEAATGRLSGLTLGGAGRGLHAEVRVSEVRLADLDRAALEATLNQAIVVGDVDRSDPSMREFVQDETFFVVRYPRTWQAGTWSSGQRAVEFTTPCGAGDGCPALNVRVHTLAEDQALEQYVEDLGKRLDLQPEYHEIVARTIAVGDQQAGTLEYLYDRIVKGKTETTRHVEYVLEGRASRYHLDFSAPAARFETYRGLFEEMALQFTYLKRSMR